MLRYAVNRVCCFLLVRATGGDPFRHGPLVGLTAQGGWQKYYAFSVRLGLLPTSGWEGWRTKILPALTLGLVPMAYCARLTRAAVRETVGEDYVSSARAKGLRRRRIVLQHVLRNSLVPV